jgi:hypothetical protein
MLKRVFYWVLVVGIVTAIFWGCGPRTTMIGSWELTPDKKSGTLAIGHERVGLVMTGTPVMRSGGETIPMEEWSIEKQADRLELVAQAKDETVTWNFQLDDGRLIIRTTRDNCYLIGEGPAGEARIPARVESQDNGILYSSLGLVSANNINHLFDRKSGDMIGFPEGTRLVRDAEDPARMKVSIPVGAATAFQMVPDYYISTLGLKYYKSRPHRFETAPVAWSSWYCYYMGANEADVVQEVDALAEHLGPFGLEYIQIDACYTRGEDANYLEWNKDLFPRGGKWFFQYVQDKGLKPALWVNIYGSNYAKAEMAEKYPDNYYLKDSEGNLSGACCTADETVARLDYSNPEVVETHLKPMFRVLKDEWGIQYLKDAGWGTWIDYFDRNKSQAFDSTRTGRDIYIEVQNALRETVGDDFYIGGCAMHEVGLGFGVFDGSRTGGDDKAVWYPEKEGGMSMQTFFNSLFGANYLHNIVWHCDPDAAMVRNPLTLEEGRTIVSAIGLTGQLYMASDFMNRLPKAKLELYQKTIPTTPIVPVDLYPYKIERNKRDGTVWCCPRVREYPRAIDLKVRNITGAYDVVALFNWEDKPGTRSLNLGGDLGLDADREYIVFDFWEERLKEIARQTITETIPIHGTKVFVIRPVLDHPQLVTTSRHITGAVSVQDVSWDDTSNRLAGTSEIVPDVPYAIFIHMPEGFTIKNVESDMEMLFYRIQDGVLEIRFSGKGTAEAQNILNWTVAFEPAS